MFERKKLLVWPFNLLLIAQKAQKVRIFSLAKALCRDQECGLYPPVT